MIYFSGYWRSGNESAIIVKCYNLIANCKYNNINKSANELCFQGHVGGLCESCDIYNSLN